MKNPLLRSFLIARCSTLLLLGALSASAAESNVMPLAGDWRFALDPSAEQTTLGRRGGALTAGDGIAQQWYNLDLTGKIKLPGILQAQGYGNEITATTPWVGALGQAQWARGQAAQRYAEPGNVKVGFTSQPPRHYLGVAWYQRDLEIPAGWQGKDIQLFLERPRWETTVWVDDRQVGSNNSLVAPHEYNLGLLTPGKHRLTVRADNRMILPYRTDGHSVSDSQGATWNGIVGRIELIAKSPVYIDDAQVFPNVAKKSALIKVKIGNQSAQPGTGTLTAGSVSKPVTWDVAGGSAEIEVPLGADFKLWDEFHPNLQHLTVALTGGQANDSRPLVFGMREITFDGPNMLLNGHVVNIRGTHNGGDFPLTGYPAMDVDSWKKIIQMCKDYGLNHMRFHSWCPPEAAFIAADELGFYFQPEAGFWDGFSIGSPMSKQLDAESDRIVKAYGNHPSFVLFCPSNESSGNYLPVWVKTWYERDPRRLYAISTGIDSDDHVHGGAQYAILAHTNNVLNASGQRGVGGLLRTNNQDNNVWFGGDYRESLRNVNVNIPVLAHELGQWCAYPDFKVIDEFKGFLRPANYEIFRDSAAEHGVLDRDTEFAWASGRFQLACYKAEIETQQRTPGMSGYQLLDIHDYLGQGTALVGVIDSLWQPKSYVTGPEYARFNGPTVPLARLGTRVLSADQPFDVDIELAHYGPEPLTNVTPYWKVVDSAGKVITQGQLATRDVPLGKNIPLGKVTLDLSKLPTPMQYKLVVGLPGTKAENDWNFWLYPAQVDTTVPADVLVTNNWADAETRLAAGGKVLFTPAPGDLGQNSPPLNNVPVFWNRMMNPRVESMMGLWCDAKHPALAGFPTEANCDWEWASMVRGVRAINIENAPAPLKPIVSAIDDWNRNWKLGVVFEAKVGPGRLMVSAINLESNTQTPKGARQLRRSLLDYMAGAKFQPPVTMTPDQARSLWASANQPAQPIQPIGTPPPEIDEGPVRPPVPPAGRPVITN